MADRTTVLGGIWAYDAPDPPTGTLPAVDTTYADSALDETTIEAGWPYAAKVDSADFNEFMRRMSTLMDYLETYGILPYCASVTYPSGARVMGSDGLVYTSLAGSNLNHAPTSSPTYWEAEYTQDMDNPGYRMTPGGFIEQWGETEFDHTGGEGYANSTYTDIVFPIEFPTECLMVQTFAGDNGTSDTAEHTYSPESITTTGFRIRITRVSGTNVGGLGDETLAQYRAFGY